MSGSLQFVTGKNYAFFSCIGQKYVIKYKCLELVLLGKSIIKRRLRVSARKSGVALNIMNKATKRVRGIQDVLVAYIITCKGETIMLRKRWISCPKPHDKLTLWRDTAGHLVGIDLNGVQQWRRDYEENPVPPTPTKSCRWRVSHGKLVKA